MRQQKKIRREVTCPRCDTSSTCSPSADPKDDPAFQVVQYVDITRPLYIVQGFAMADADNEIIEDSPSRPRIYCVTCGYIFDPPRWMNNHVLVAERTLMLKTPNALVKTAKKAIRER